MAKWRFEENIAELNKPVDKERWGMSPQTVNAYYNPSNNEIVFPAAIYNHLLQLQADEAELWRNWWRYGHEISHGFDDSGSRYNADGNLDWWTAEFKTISALTGALTIQRMEPLPGTL
jgi:predicted metalloendopeptidase